ncbi:hypothetical protein ARMGADRAFT_1023282 [Armillaria gallica]|uniref:Uncharacterized protein n=1 Tax=Armillaria gallica TaxID=47427 RepID=A0A2H3E384_ARMGA|nr:hypothetical protein ARMGADRAFT_1023282 [Armillaria gallica]
MLKQWSSLCRDEMISQLGVEVLSHLYYWCGILGGASADPDQCAVGLDGQLKDSGDIKWFYGVNDSASVAGLSSKDSDLCCQGNEEALSKVQARINIMNEKPAGSLASKTISSTSIVKDSKKQKCPHIRCQGSSIGKHCKALEKQAVKALGKLLTR